MATRLPEVELKADASASGQKGSQEDSLPVQVEGGGCNDGHTAHAFSEMSCMRDNGLLCDVRLCVGDVEIEAHRVVLASRSPYFRAMFTGGLAESQTSTAGQPLIVKLKGVDASAVKQLVAYCYNSCINIDDKSVQNILPAASMLHLEPVVAQCCEFLKDQLHVSNCLGFEAFAEQHGCVQLVEQCRSFAAQKFEQLVKEDEFLELNADRACSLLSRGDLRVLSEKAVFDATLRWLRHVPDGQSSREEYNRRLLSCVRFPLIPSDVLSFEVHNSREVKDSGQDLLVDAYRFHVAVEKRNELQSSSTKPRRPADIDCALVAVGGGSLFAIHGDCEIYDEEENCWKRLPAGLQLRRARHATAVLYNQLYAAGGWNGSGDLNSVERYCALSGQWQYVAPLSYRRSALGLAELGGVLYALGGHDGTNCLSSVERYDPLRNQWTPVASMSKPRRYVRAAVLRGRLVACGGFDSNAHQDTVEAFDPREGSWVKLPSMISRRSSAAVTSLDDELFVTGGSDGSTCLNTVECYDDRMECWKHLTPMTLQRNTHDCVALNGRLYCCGGNDGQTSMSSVECFDINSGSWSTVASMSTRRSSVGIAVSDITLTPHYRFRYDLA